MEIAKVLFAFVFIGFNAISQTDSLKKLQYIGFDFHVNANRTLVVSQSDFKKIAKEKNAYLLKDSNKYRVYNQGPNYSAGIGININGGFNLLKNKPNSITRFSLGFDSYDLLESYYIADSIAYLKHVTSNDSLYNSFDIVKQTTNVLSYKNSIKTLSFSAAQLFSTDRNKYLSVYWGVSFSGNISVSSVIYGGQSISVQASTIDSVTGHVTGLYQLSKFGTYDYETATSKAKAFGIMTIGLPVGAELRFSKTRKRLKHLSFAIEFIPQVNYIITPKLSKQAYVFFRVTPFNLIYRF